MPVRACSCVAGWEIVPGDGLIALFAAKNLV